MNEMNTFIPQGCIKLIKNYSKDLHCFIWNKCCFFF